MSDGHTSRRVGVYVDGFNLYYGGLGSVGSRHSSGWKWLDVRALATRFCGWRDAHITRVVYCTARVNDPEDPAQTQRQDFYLRALLAAGSVDVVEEGYYSSWAKESPMTNEKSGTKAPTRLKDPEGKESWSGGLKLRRSPDGAILATVRKREEKGSDVNVATHLLVDILTNQVDAAIVISNDSDLALPLSVARNRAAVGLINPSGRSLAGALKGDKAEGAGGHWWRHLNDSDWLESQLPDPVADIHKPSAW